MTSRLFPTLPVLAISLGIALGTITNVLAQSFRSDGISGLSIPLLTYDSANILAQRNGTNGQVLRIYGTYTDAGNYERLAITTGAVTNSILQEQLGTGVARGLRIGTVGTASVIFRTTNVDRWLFNNSGHYTPAIDNAYDLGSSSLGVRNAYVGTSLTIAGGTPLTSHIETTCAPTITNTVGAYTTTVVNYCTYTKTGRLVTINVSVSVTALGTATGSMNISLPVAAGAVDAFGVARNTSSGVMGAATIFASGTEARLHSTTGTAFGASTETFKFTVTYQAAS